MMEESEQREEEYELKPAVKWTAAGILLALVVALEITTYRIGVSHGREDPSPAAQARSDAKAVLNLNHFLQCLSTDDATLTNMANNRSKELSWIKEKPMLREAKWLLGEALLQRGLIASARPLFDELFGDQSTPLDKMWTLRLEITAAAESKQGDPQRALSAYTRARKYYEASKSIRDELRCLNHEIELLTIENNPQNLVAALKQLYARAGELGDEGLELQVSTLAHLGRIFRAQGDIEGSNKYFQLAVQAWNGEPRQELASSRICLGEALLEAGSKEEARKQLEQGIAECAATGTEGDYLLSGLRSLARLAAERNEQDEALAYLYRAEGIARTVLEKDSPYWPCLYDQRGWILLNKNVPELALADFRKAASYTGEPSALTQAYEGIGRASLELGHADEAQAALEKAVSLRDTYFANDFVSKARVNHLLGMACDMKGNTNESIIAYSRALKNIHQTNSSDFDSLKTDILLSLAYAYSEKKQWERALPCWEEALPLIAAERQQEIRNQLNECRRELAKKPAAPEPIEEDDDTSSQ